MNCREAQLNLSLYLYGELDFAQEENLERHLAGCALCRKMLEREKAWHASLNSDGRDVPLELLNECRQGLHTAMAQHPHQRRPVSWRSWFDPFSFAPGRWSVRLAMASFLVFVGFTAARWFGDNGWSGMGGSGFNDMSVVNPVSARIRDIRPGGGPNQVRILVQQINEREVSGTPENENIRRLLIAAMQDPADPGIRVDSVEMLKGQNGADVRNALLRTVRQDPNAAVRMKALENLRPFSSEGQTRKTLEFVLQHDDSPAVRSEAIDVLAPMGQRLMITPDFAAALQNIMRSERESDYVRERCLQVLHDVNLPMDIY